MFFFLLFINNNFKAIVSDIIHQRVYTLEMSYEAKLCVVECKKEAIPHKECLFKVVSGARETGDGAYVLSEYVMPFHSGQMRGNAVKEIVRIV